MKTATRLLFSTEKGVVQFVGEFSVVSAETDDEWHVAISQGTRISGDYNDDPNDDVVFEEAFAVAVTDTAVVAAGSVADVAFDPDKQQTLVWAAQMPSDGTVTGNPEEEFDD